MFEIRYNCIFLVTILIFQIWSKNVLSLDQPLRNESSDCSLCSKASAAKGILQVAGTLTDALNQIIGSALEKYNSVEKSVCSTEKDGFSSLKDDLLSAPSDCAAVQKGLNFKTNGVYRIWPRYLNHAVMVYCDMTTDGGGWTVFQRRVDTTPAVDFFRNFEDYRTGFGNLTSEFWLGNDALFALTNQEESTLRIELQDFEGIYRYAKYSTFIVDSSLRKFKLTIGGYSGDAGDSMALHNEAEFSTFDVDGEPGKCARDYKGGWWYKACHHANLNGRYLRGNHSTFADGVDWYHWKGYHYSLKETQMKIRPKSFQVSQ